MTMTEIERKAHVQATMSAIRPAYHAWRSAQMSASMRPAGEFDRQLAIMNALTSSSATPTAPSPSPAYASSPPEPTRDELLRAIAQTPGAARALRAGHTVSVECRGQRCNVAYEQPSGDGFGEMVAALASNVAYEQPSGDGFGEMVAALASTTASPPTSNRHARSAMSVADIEATR